LRGQEIAGRREETGNERIRSLKRRSRVEERSIVKERGRRDLFKVGFRMPGLEILFVALSRAVLRLFREFRGLYAVGFLSDSHLSLSSYRNSPINSTFLSSRLQPRVPPTSSKLS